MGNNTNRELDDCIKDVPFRISTKTIMDEPNQKISIHKGVFTISSGEDSTVIDGEVWFDWFPIIGVKFEGNANSNNTSLVDFTKSRSDLKLSINGCDFGEANITELIIEKSVWVSGRMVGTSIMGTKSIPVSKISFSIPNLRTFIGLPVKTVKTDGSFSLERDRLVFENEDYIIIIDKRVDYKEMLDALKKKGGYVILYSGEIEKRKGHITFEDYEELRHCLTFFLSFLNGRRCTPLIFSGIHDQEIFWIDYSVYPTSIFENVLSWPQKTSTIGLSELWDTFSRLWMKENKREVLVLAIHWYIEANSNSGYLEGAVVMTQTALELLYNWAIIEKGKILRGKDGESLSASNKIRLLLSHINATGCFPHSLSRMKSYLKSNKKDLHDEIDVFVQIRNAIIHSQEDKRNKLASIPIDVKHEALEFGLWCLEMSLLTILNFKGKYCNRCSGALWSGADEEPFPLSRGCE